MFLKPKDIEGVRRPNQNDRNIPVWIRSLCSLTLWLVIKAEQKLGGFKAEHVQLPTISGLINTNGGGVLMPKEQ
jgi:hypothetical protein